MQRRPPFNLFYIYLFVDRLLSLSSRPNPPPEMSLIGEAFNKILQKNIPVYIAKSGDGYVRITSAISPAAKQVALNYVKERFENGTLFKDDDLKQMESLTIT